MGLFRYVAAGASAALLAFATAAPLVAHAQQKLRVQSAFPPSSMIHENAKLWAERVKAMSGGRLLIELLPAGAVVPPFEVLDAVHKKVVHGGHTAPAYWVGKNRAATLFGPAPGGPFGMDMVDYLGWLTEGGGQDLYRAFYQDQLKRNVVPIPLTFVGGQALGWFKQPIHSWNDFKGRKCRQTGITAEVFSRSGMRPVNLPGGEIVPAGERGVIDCAEFVGAAEDMKIGFQTIWKNFYVPSIHEPATVLELLINADVWKALAPELQQIVLSAAMEATLRSQIAMHRADAAALVEMQSKHGVKVQRTPDDVLQKILESWDQIAKEEAAKNPFFKQVYESQRDYASKVVPTRRLTTPPYEFTANYYWPAKR
jgi:TRAP-type mannitol/chloroaromatic compound transport system substrate-binding protein